MEIVNGILSEGEVVYLRESIPGSQHIRDLAAISLGISVALGREWMGWIIPRPRKVVCFQHQWTNEVYQGVVGVSIIDPSLKTAAEGREVIQKLVSAGIIDPSLKVEAASLELGFLSAGKPGTGAGDES